MKGICKAGVFALVIGLAPLLALGQANKDDKTVKTAPPKAPAPPVKVDQKQGVVPPPKVIQPKPAPKPEKAPAKQEKSPAKAEKSSSKKSKKDKDDDDSSSKKSKKDKKAKKDDDDDDDDEPQQARSGGGSRGAAAASEPSCPWTQAKAGLDQVEGNHDVRHNFLRGRERGMSCYDAVLAALSRNSSAQAAIRSCGPMSSNYIGEQDICRNSGFSQASTGDAESDCIDADAREGNSCDLEVVVTAKNRCRAPQDVQVCIDAEGGGFQCWTHMSVGSGMTVTRQRCGAGGEYQVQHRPTGSGVRFETPR